MFARVTMFELDTVRIPLKDAVAQFEAEVIPGLRGQPGYEGVYVLSTPEWKGLLMSLWATESAAEFSESSGFYDAQVAKFLLLLRTPPGRDHYEVVYSSLPQPTLA